MKNKLILIFCGIIFLIAALFVGTPFEFLNSAADSFANVSMILLILFLFIILYQQTKKLTNRILRRITYGLLVVLTIPYLLLAIWTLLLTASSYHPMWQDVSIYTNEKNEKVISQWRETSGSIYDYRDRKIISDFGQFRISLDCNIDNLKGTWTKYNIDNMTTEKVNFDDRKDNNSTD